jgi:hypothetical protein
MVAVEYESGEAQTEGNKRVTDERGVGMGGAP